MKISDMLLAKKRFIVLKESNKRYHIIFQKNEREGEGETTLRCVSEMKRYNSESVMRSVDMMIN